VPRPRRRVAGAWRRSCYGAPFFVRFNPMDAEQREELT
jgi:hypothetical protein